MDDRSERERGFIAVAKSRGVLFLFTVKHEKKREMKRDSEEESLRSGKF